MKIALISPGIKAKQEVRYPINRLLTCMAGNLHLTLPYLAALIPSEIDVHMIDETYYNEVVDYDIEVDLVGMTVLTPTVLRAYEIADEFRKREIPVVMGGIHPTVMAHEAITHANAVILGEAEGVWEELLSDFAKGKLRKFYRRNSYHCLRNLPVPRWDLVQRYQVFSPIPIQISRGCPFHCKFCSVSFAQGRKYRYRPIEDIIREIEMIESKYLYVVDNNLVGNPRYAKKLLERMIHYEKYWIGAASVTVADDEELLRLLKKSGCMGLDIGFESLVEENLKEIGKPQNKIEKYTEVIKKLHDHGIAVIGSFIFGFDHDDRSIFEKTLKFCFKNNIDIVGPSIIIPYPGTPLYHKLLKERRLFNEKWWLDKGYWIERDTNFTPNIPFQPKLMSPEELLNGFLFIWNESYKFTSIAERMRGAGQRGWFRLFFYALSNLVLKKYYSPIF